MRRRRPRATRSDALFPPPTLFRSGRAGGAWHGEPGAGRGADDAGGVADQHRRWVRCTAGARSLTPAAADAGARSWRSEEHTSELQSLMRISYAVFCLKKKNTEK